MIYYFILGKNKNLSIAELFSRPELKNLKLSQKDVFLLKNVLFVKTDLKIDARKILNFLGGTIKIGKIEKEFKDFSAIESNDIIGLIKNKKGKIPFGFSLVNVQSRKFIKNLAWQIKKDFRNKKINSRWIEAKGEEISSVVVGKNKLIEKGAEIYIFKRKEKVCLGKTLAVQDFQGYSFRDCFRPQRDIKSGMIPPKLAQIMLNLAKLNKKDILLDPFCGSGTVLQEAVLTGYKNIIGADISQKAIQDTKANLEWFKKHFTFLGKEAKKQSTKLFLADVCQLGQKIKPHSVGAIVTEPFLGTTSKKFNLQAQLVELSRLYLTAFQEFKKVLKKEGKVVIIFPVFVKKMIKERQRNNPNVLENFIFLPILSKIQSLGFQTKPFGREEFKDLIETTSRGSLLYSRPTPNRRILREIFIWEKSG